MTEKRRQDWTSWDWLAEHIVNPHCDECGQALPSPGDGLPDLCADCWAVNRAEFERRLAEFIADKGKTRSVHIVKLPEGMKP